MWWSSHQEASPTAHHSMSVGTVADDTFICIHIYIYISLSLYIYIWGRLARCGKPGCSPGAPVREQEASRITSRSVARRTGAEPRRVPWWLVLVRLGGLPGWSDPLDLDRVPARGGRFCKADWASRARNPNFVRHTSAAECKQKWRPRKLNSGLPTGWLPDLFTSSPAVLYVLRFGRSKTLENNWFL